MTERWNVVKVSAVEFGTLARDDYKLWISANAVQAMLTFGAAAGRRETGGIVIGRYDPDGRTVEVVEATPKPPGSSAGCFWFQRGEVGLKELLADRWNSGFYYVGEWHFHPDGSPKLSGRDIRAMQKIAIDPRYQCQKPILFILGGRPPVSWTLSATVFVNQIPVSVKQGR
jgi:proteasome lid subunit RPN8/RPN11